MTAIEIVDAITDRLGPAITLRSFIHLGTPRRITEELRTWPGGNLVDPTIIQLRPGESGKEIFFVHPASGSVFCYHKLAKHTAFPGPAYALAYPFEELDPPDTVPAMAEYHIGAMRQISPHGPYRLAGYSLGGNLALEMAYQLERAGERVTDITIIDAAPLEAYPPRATEADYLRSAPLTLAFFLGLPIALGDGADRRRGVGIVAPAHLVSAY